MTVSWLTAIPTLPQAGGFTGFLAVVAMLWFLVLDEAESGV
jgi:hypothetical protein